MGLFSRVLILLFSLILAGSLAFAAASPALDIPDQHVSSSSGVFDNIVFLTSFVKDSDTPKENIHYTITSQSNSDIRCIVDGGVYIDCYLTNGFASGFSVVDVEARDPEGNTGHDPMTVYFNGGSSNGSSSSVCSDIDIQTNTIRINEDSSDTFSLTLQNLSARRDFHVTDVRFNESSGHFRIFDKSFGSIIPADNEINLDFSVESFSVNSNTDEFVTVQVEGYFDNSFDCSFNDISDSFRVFVQDTGNGLFDNSNSGSSGSICSDVVIDDSRIALSEDDFETIEVTVRNDNSRAFYIDFVERPVENSSYFSVSVLSRPDKISGGSDGTIRLRFETEKVSADQSGNILLRINGHFSNGTNCSTSQIREQISVVVENGNSQSGGSASTASGIDIRFNQASIELKPGESKFVLATIENNSRSRKCMDLEFVSSSPVSGELDDDSICISAQSNLSVNVKVKAGLAAMPGTYTGRLRVQVGSKAASETLAVNVLGTITPQPEGSLEVLNYPSTVKVLQNDSETISVVVSNSSNAALANVSVSIENLPQGVFFQPYFRQTLEKGEIATINSKLQAVNAQPAQFDAMLRISADGKTAVKPITVVVLPHGTTTAGGSSISGLASLAGAVGVGLLLLLALVVIILIVVYLVRR